MSIESRGNPFSKDGMTQVRCCCNPCKLLGYLPYDGPTPYISMKVEFKKNDGTTTQEELHVITLKWTSGYAFKSNDKGMDHFRGIKGFVEAK